MASKAQWLRGLPFVFFLFSKQRGLPVQHKKYFLENWKRTKEGVSNKQIIISLFCLKHTIHANWCLTCQENIFFMISYKIWILNNNMLNLY